MKRKFLIRTVSALTAFVLMLSLALSPVCAEDAQAVWEQEALSADEDAAASDVQEDAETGEEADSETDTEAEADVDLGADTEADTETDSETDADVVTGTETEAAAKTDAAADTETDTDAVADAEVNSESEANPETEADAETDPEADTEAGAAAEIPEESGDGAEECSRSVYTYSDSEITVTAKLEDASAIPDEAKLTAVEVACGDSGYEEAIAALNEVLDGGGADSSNTILYDISFTLDGEELEPAQGSVSVSITFTGDQLSSICAQDSESITVIHLSEEDGSITAEEVDADASGGSIEFTLESFSIIATYSGSDTSVYSSTSVGGGYTDYTYSTPVGTLGSGKLYGFSSDDAGDLYCVEAGATFKSGYTYTTSANAYYDTGNYLLAAKLKYVLDTNDYGLDSGQKRWILQKFLWLNDVFGINYSGLSETNASEWVLNDDGTADSLYASIVADAQAVENVTGGVYLYSTTAVDSSGNSNQKLGLIVYEIQGYLYFQKIDTSDSGYSLAEALYGVYSDSTCTNNVGYFITGRAGTGYVATSSGTGGFSAVYNGTTYTSLSDGTTYLVLDAGTYYVKELVATSNEYFALSSEVIRVSVDADGTATAEGEDTLNTFPVRVKKSAAVTHKYVAYNSAYSLSGAVYKLYKSMDTSGTCYATFTTTSDGTSNVAYLEPGTYYLTEETASQGYLKDTTWITVSVTNSESTQTISVTEPVDAEPLGLIVLKTDEDGNAIEAAGVKFSLKYTYTNRSGKSVSETYIFASDENGIVDFSDPSYLDSSNTATPYTDSDGKICFFAGTITITETKAPAGYQLADVVYSAVLTVDDDGYIVITEDTGGYEYNSSGYLEWINNKITIDTVLVDKTTGTKNVLASQSMSFTDTISYKNLNAGSRYTITGYLYDLTTGAEAMDDEGNTITASVSFRPSESSGTTILTYSFSGTSLEGHVLVSFAELTDSDGTLLAEHKEQLDERQTVYVPQLDTVLTAVSDDGTSSKSAFSDAGVTLSDAVYAENLYPGYTYRLEGTIVSKTTGDTIAEAQTEFTAGASDVSLTQTFTFDATSFNGEYIAYEVLYLVTDDGEYIVANHSDSDDYDQTVTIAPALPSTGGSGLYIIIAGCVMLFAGFAAFSGSGGKKKGDESE